MIKGIPFPLSKVAVIPAIMLYCIVAAHPEVLSDPGSGEKQEQIEKIESQLSSQKGKLKTVYSREKDLLAGLDALEKDVEEKRRSVEDLKKKIRLAAVETRGLKEKLKETRRASRDAEARLARKLITLYKFARKGYVRLITDVRDMDEFWRRMKYLKAIVKEDRRELARLAQGLSRRQAKVARAKQAVLEKEGMINKERRQLVSLRKDLEKKALRLMKVHGEKEFYETAVRELQLAAKDLRQALSKVEKKEPHRMLQTLNFQDAGGKLPFPLEGKIIRDSTSIPPSRPKLHEGVFIEGASDPSVRAIFPGRVDFSGRLSGYGEIVIINHGSRFFTVSARLRKRNKKEGDVVAAGEVIGQAGNGGPSPGGRLYFEIRRGVKNLDPLKWLKVR